jgi:hypothetical protein
LTQQDTTRSPGLDLLRSLTILLVITWHIPQSYYPWPQRDTPFVHRKSFLEIAQQDFRNATQDTSICNNTRKKIRSDIPDWKRHSSVCGRLAKLRVVLEFAATPIQRPHDLRAAHRDCQCV